MEGEGGVGGRGRVNSFEKEMQNVMNQIISLGIFISWETEKGNKSLNQ